MGFCSPTKELYVLGAIALTVAFLSASQDIVIDAYRVDTIPAERARPGRRGDDVRLSHGGDAGGRGAGVDRRELGLALAFLFVAGLMAATMLATLWAPEPETPGHPPRTLADAVWHPLRELLSQKGHLGILAARAALQGGRCSRAQPVQHFHDQGRRVFPA